MTLEDLCRALLPPAVMELSGSDGNRGVPRVPPSLQLADLNQDGLISHSEYVFFITLLSIRPRDLFIAFRMFDLDQNGTLDARELQTVLRVLNMKNPCMLSLLETEDLDLSDEKLPEIAGEVELDTLMAFFRASDGKVTYRSFMEVFAQVHRSVHEIEFELWDHEHNGYMTPFQFGLSIASRAPPSDIDEYVGRAQILRDMEGRITPEENHEFLIALDSLEKIVSAINLYTLDKPNRFNKGSFARAFTAVTGFTIPSIMVDVIFVMLDRDGDGVLDFDELVTALRRHKLSTRTEQTTTWRCVRSCFVN